MDNQATLFLEPRVTCHAAVEFRSDSHSTLLSRFVPLLTNFQVTHDLILNHLPDGAGSRLRSWVMLLILPLMTWVNIALLTLMERFRLESTVIGITFSTTNIQVKPKE